MLDASLSDATRYELKLHDLIVVSLDRERGPDSVSWSADEKLACTRPSVFGFDKDTITSRPRSPRRRALTIQSSATLIPRARRRRDGAGDRR
jgi:hypothetical protein